LVVPESTPKRLAFERSSCSNFSNKTFLYPLWPCEYPQFDYEKIPPGTSSAKHGKQGQQQVVKSKDGSINLITKVLKCKL
jgi:hypothetical protein